MQKFQCLLFVFKRSYISYYIICMTVPVILETEEVLSIFIYVALHTLVPFKTRVNHTWRSELY